MRARASVWWKCIGEHHTKTTLSSHSCFNKKHKLPALTKVTFSFAPAWWTLPGMIPMGTQTKQPETASFQSTVSSCQNVPFKMWMLCQFRFFVTKLNFKNETIFACAENPLPFRKHTHTHTSLCHVFAMGHQKWHLETNVEWDHKMNCLWLWIKTSHQHHVTSDQGGCHDNDHNQKTHTPKTTRFFGASTDLFGQCTRTTSEMESAWQVNGPLKKVMCF